MKARLKLISVSAAAVMLLAGCGGGSTKDGKAAGDGGELTFASWQWLEPGRGDQLWQAVQSYQSVNAKATLKQQAIARKDYESTIKTQIGGRGGPDILIIPDSFLP